MFDVNAPLTYKVDERASNLVRKVIQDENWVSYDEKKHYDCNFQWKTGGFVNRDYMQLWPDQFLNHCLQTHNITQKDILTKLVSAHKSIKNGIFDYYPKTYVLPYDYSRLVRNSRIYDTEINAKKIKQVNCSKVDKTNTVTPGASKKKQFYWIYKPAISSRGRGISISNNLSCFIDRPFDLGSFKSRRSYKNKYLDLSETGVQYGKIRTDTRMNNVVIQQYIDKPLLISGYKFDLRIYVLVTSFRPLEIYINQTGLARFATRRYTLQDLDDKFIHLTNTSINKNQAKNSKRAGCKWPLSQLRKYFKQNNIDDSHTFSQIVSIIIQTVALQANAMPKQNAIDLDTPAATNCFELYGFDILIDENMKPWLLEVNFSPSLVEDCSVDKEVKVPLLKSIFMIIRQKCVQKRKEMERQISKTRIKASISKKKLKLPKIDKHGINNCNMILDEPRKVYGNATLQASYFYPVRKIGSLYKVFPFNNITNYNARNVKVNTIISECQRLFKYRENVVQRIRDEENDYNSKCGSMNCIEGCSISKKGAKSRKVKIGNKIHKITFMKQHNKQCNVHCLRTKTELGTHDERHIWI